MSRAVSLVVRCQLLFVLFRSWYDICFTIIINRYTTTAVVITVVVVVVMITESRASRVLGTNYNRVRTHGIYVFAW